MKGIPFDTPIPGYKTRTVNRLRLWKSEAVDSFDLGIFNSGDYAGAVRAKMESETISKVLYPPDEKIEGKRLRLTQQFFFTSCSLQDMVRLHLGLGKPLTEFDKKWTVQLNDTHPSIGIAELMRLLMDEHADGLGRCVARDAVHLWLHQPHASSRGAGALAVGHVRESAAAASRDHLRDQSPVSG